LFVADARAGRILRVDARTLDASIAAANLSAPGALALDAAGNLYIADQGTGRILEIPRAVPASDGALHVLQRAAGGQHGHGGVHADQ
jgi:sugar lactone lactonase YvrE